MISPVRSTPVPVTTLIELSLLNSSPRPPFLFCRSSAKILRNVRASAVHRPAQRCALIDGVFDVQSRSPFHQEPHDHVMARANGLMERRRVTVVPLRVISIGIFA